MTLSVTAPHKQAVGESVLDRMPDSMILFAEMVEKEDWIHEDDSDEEERENEQDDVDRPESSRGLDEDSDQQLLSQDQHLNEFNAEHDESQDMTCMLRPITKKEHEYMKQRMLALSKHRQAQRKGKQVRRVPYMPSMHSRIYKEWTETQAAQVIFCNVLNHMYFVPIVLTMLINTDMIENPLGHLDPQRRQSGEALNSLHHFLSRTTGRSAQSQPHSRPTHTPACYYWG